MKWQIVIQDKKGKLRRIPLDHEYETEWEAESEAENIAAEEYSENDEAWSLRKMSKSQPVNRRRTKIIFYSEIPKKLHHAYKLQGKFLDICCGAKLDGIDVTIHGFCSPIQFGRRILGKTRPTVVVDSCLAEFSRKNKTIQGISFWASNTVVHELLHNFISHREEPVEFALKNIRCLSRKPKV